MHGSAAVRHVPMDIGGRSFAWSAPQYGPRPHAWQLARGKHVMASKRGRTTTEAEGDGEAGRTDDWADDPDPEGIGLAGDGGGAEGACGVEGGGGVGCGGGEERGVGKADGEGRHDLVLAAGMRE